MKKYNPKKIELKWQKIWQEKKVFAAEDFDNSRPKKFLAEMFPYPSGAGLHVGHVRNFTLVDVLTRFYRQQGYNVLRPFGYDTFGLPAENYAIKTGVSPKIATAENIHNFRYQMKKLGFAIDWDREINTSDPEYYHWTQWIFARLFEKGLAYKKESLQWWCPFDKTVLANEQVENGKCWRCGKPVEKKKMNQWFFKITEYAEELLADLDDLDWPNKIKIMQKNWIGKSEGEEIEFVIDGFEEKIKVFTTRPETIFGATFIVLAPEHLLVSKITTQEKLSEVERYLEQSLKKSEIERQENKEKTGVWTGSFAINSATKEKISIWIADYVLPNYGTGAIMAVPRDDERDKEFAKKFNLPIIENYEFSNQQFGEKKVNYRIRDWLISRQRYWGCPIPIAYDKHGQPHLIPDDQLPVLLPEIDDFQPDDSGRSALAKNKDWLKVKINGEEMTRETDTMDGYADSSWYLLRYADPSNQRAAWDKKLVEFWNPVDIYVGADHAVAHLLYVRFWTKIFADLGLIGFREPIKKLIYHGYINAPDGKKMSKSKGNVIDPLEVIDSGYGADTLRMYEMFIAPYEVDAPWNIQGVGGVYRFLNRVWNLTQQVLDHQIKIQDELLVKKTLAKMIKKVSDDLERQSFNTAIAALMESLNIFDKTGIDQNGLKIFARLLNPFAPHLSAEIWELLGEKILIDNAGWPKFERKYLLENEIKIGVQINGKVRGEILLSIDADEKKALELAKENQNVANYLIGKEIKKIIFVPKKILNILI